MRKECTLALKTPGFELLYHLSAMWSWVSYLVSLSFKFLICKIGQIYLLPSTVSNRIKFLKHLAFPSLFKNIPLTYCYHSAYAAFIPPQVHDHPKPHLALHLVFQVCKYFFICKSYFWSQNLVWLGQFASWMEARHDSELMVCFWSQKPLVVGLSSPLPSLTTLAKSCNFSESQYCLLKNENFSQNRAKISQMRQNLGVK